MSSPIVYPPEIDLTTILRRLPLSKKATRPKVQTRASIVQTRAAIVLTKGAIVYTTKTAAAYSWYTNKAAKWTSLHRHNLIVAFVKDTKIPLKTIIIKTQEFGIDLITS